MSVDDYDPDWFRKVLACDYGEGAASCIHLHAKVYPGTFEMECSDCGSRFLVPDRLPGWLERTLAASGNRMTVRQFNDKGELAKEWLCSGVTLTVTDGPKEPNE